MSTSDQALAPFRKFRATVVRYSLIVTSLAALIAYPFSPIVTQGLLLGGIAGIIGFWMMARGLAKLATVPSGKVQFAVLTWSLYRFALYGAVLFKAYTLDDETYHGMAAAVAGILIVRLVLMFLGFTGIDLGRPKPSDQDDRQH